MVVFNEINMIIRSIDYLHAVSQGDEWNAVKSLSDRLVYSVANQIE